MSKELLDELFAEVVHALADHSNYQRRHYRTQDWARYVAAKDAISAELDRLKAENAQDAAMFKEEIDACSWLLKAERKITEAGSKLAEAADEYFSSEGNIAEHDTRVALAHYKEVKEGKDE